MAKLINLKATSGNGDLQIMMKTTVFCLFVFLLVYIGDLHATPIVGIWDVEYGNIKAREDVPDTRTIISAFESALRTASAARFEVWSSDKVHQNLSGFCGSVFRHYNTGPLPNILIRIFVSRFSDRLEIDVWMYTRVKLPNRLGSSQAVTIAVSHTATEPIDIFTAINKLSREMADKISSLTVVEYQRRVLVEAFESRNEQIRLPVYVMFVTDLVQNHYVVLTYESAIPPDGCRGGTWKDDMDHNLEELRRVDESRKKEIMHYNRVDAIISGRIEEIGSTYVISTSLSDPFRDKMISSSQTPLGIHPEDVRRASERAAQRLLEEYVTVAEGILLDIQMTVRSEPVVRTETILVRGKPHLLTIRFSIRDYLSTTQTGRWTWKGEEESKPFAWLDIDVDGVRTSRVSIDYTNIGRAEAFGRSPILIPTNLGFHLLVYEVYPEVERTTAFLGERGTLRSVTIKLLVETDD